jgi:hypothetical protein
VSQPNTPTPAGVPASRLTKADADHIINLMMSVQQAATAHGEAWAAPHSPEWKARLRETEATLDQTRKAVIDAAYALVDWAAEFTARAGGEVR